MTAYSLATYGYRTRLVGEASRAALLGREYRDGRVGGGGVRGRDGARALDAVGIGLGLGLGLGLRVPSTLSV